MPKRFPPLLAHWKMYWMGWEQYFKNLSQACDILNEHYGEDIER